MIPTAISSSSTIRTRLHPARLIAMKRNRLDEPTWPALHHQNLPIRFEIGQTAGEIRQQTLLFEYNLSQQRLVEGP
jgi:hypothetical protein